MSLVVTPDAAATAAPVVDPAAPAVVDPAVAATAASAVETPAAVVAAAPVRPEGLADAFWDDAAGVKTPEVLARLTELEAADAARVAGVPADASGYKLETAEPIMGPDGKTPIAFNADDPLAKGATAWAHANGIPQKAVSELLGLFAGSEIAAMKANNDRIAAELGKLGANSDARFTALNASLTAHAGAEGAKAIMATLGSAAAVEAMEKLTKALAGPSVGSPPANSNSSSSGLSGVELLNHIRATKG